MDQDELQSRARSLLGQAGDAVHAAAHPGDELGPPGADAAVLDPVVRDLNELESLLGPGVGPANTDEGLPKLRAAVETMEGLVTSRPGQGSPIFLSEDGRRALRHAVALLKQVRQLYS